MNIGKVVFFAYSDGSVEYRDRATMAEIFNDHDLNKVWHLSQIGFAYSDDDPCTYLRPFLPYGALISSRLAGGVVAHLLLPNTTPRRRKGQVEATRISIGGVRFGHE